MTTSFLFYPLLPLVHFIWRDLGRQLLLGGIRFHMALLVCIFLLCLLSSFGLISALVIPGMWSFMVR